MLRCDEKNKPQKETLLFKNRKENLEEKREKSVQHGKKSAPALHYKSWCWTWCLVVWWNFYFIWTWRWCWKLENWISKEADEEDFFFALARLIRKTSDRKRNLTFHLSVCISPEISSNLHRNHFTDYFHRCRPRLIVFFVYIRGGR